MEVFSEKVPNTPNYASQVRIGTTAIIARIELPTIVQDFKRLKGELGMKRRLQVGSVDDSGNPSDGPHVHHHRPFRTLAYRFSGSLVRNPPDFHPSPWIFGANFTVCGNINFRSRLPEISRSARPT